MLDGSSPSWMDDGQGKRKRQNVAIPFKRLPGEVKIEHTHEVVRCRVMLNDLSPTGVGIFLETKVDIGSKITLVLEHPKHLFLKGEILWCNLFSLHTNVISTEAFNYRAGIRFEFATPQEAEEFQKYCDTLFGGNGK